MWRESTVVAVALIYLAVVVLDSVRGVVLFLSSNRSNDNLIFAYPCTTMITHCQFPCTWNANPPRVRYPPQHFFPPFLSLLSLAWLMMKSWSDFLFYFFPLFFFLFFFFFVIGFVYLFHSNSTGSVPHPCLDVCIRICLSFSNWRGEKVSGVGLGTGEIWNGWNKDRLLGERIGSQ